MMVKIDKVLRAPQGSEVEECTPLEISEILKESQQIYGEPSARSPTQMQLQSTQLTAPSKRHHTPRTERHTHQQVFQVNEEHDRNADETESLNLRTKTKTEFQNQDPAIGDAFNQINETLEAIILDENKKTLMRLPVSDVVKKIDEVEGAKILVLDGIITQRLLDAADKAGIEHIIAHRQGDIKNRSAIKLNTFSQLGLTAN